MDKLVRLTYLEDSEYFKTEKPFMTFPGLLKRFPDSNCSAFRGPEQLIKDVRGDQNDFSLSQQGFVFRGWSSSKIDWHQEGQIVDDYLPQVKKLLLEELSREQKVARCEIFDWRVIIPFPSFLFTLYPALWALVPRVKPTSSSSATVTRPTCLQR